LSSMEAKTHQKHSMGFISFPSLGEGHLSKKLKEPISRTHLQGLNSFGFITSPLFRGKPHSSFKLFGQ